MIKKTFLVLFLFVCALALFLVARIPASVAWQHVIAPATNVRSVGVLAKSFSGTVWNGKAHIAFRHIEGVLSWDVQLSKVFWGSLPATLELRSTAGDIDADIVASISEQSVQFDSVTLAMDALNPFLRPQRVKLDGDLFVKNLRLVAKDSELMSVAGRFGWSGGDVSYLAGRSMRQRSFPSFSGSLNTDDTDTISVGIRDQGASFDVMRGDWSYNGDAVWEVTRRLLDIAQEPWSQNSSESDVVFKLKKPIPRSWINE